MEAEHHDDDDDVVEISVSKEKDRRQRPLDWDSSPKPESNKTFLQPLEFEDPGEYFDKQHRCVLFLSPNKVCRAVVDAEGKYMYNKTRHLTQHGMSRYRAGTHFEFCFVVQKKVY